MKKKLKYASFILCAALLTSGCSDGAGIREPAGGSSSAAATASQTSVSSSAEGTAAEEERESAGANRYGEGDNSPDIAYIEGLAINAKSEGRTGSTEMSYDAESGSASLVQTAANEKSVIGDAGVWTVFVYMCGSDLESVDGSATEDLSEMQDATEDCATLRFVVQTGGTSAWDNDLCEGRATQRILIEDGKATELYNGAALNMGDPYTLADFVKWGRENFSSEYMALDFWDHGGGSITGVCFDELFDYDSLTLKEIDLALTLVGDYSKDFELIGFDACLMADMETVNILVPFARYALCSQNLESGYGWDYQGFADAINSGKTSGGEVGQVVADEYYRSCERTGEDGEATVSVIDLSETADLVECFDIYSRLFYEYAEENGAGDMIKAAKSAMNFGGNNNTEGYTNMVDVQDLVYQLSQYVSLPDDLPALDQQFTKELRDCVVYVKNGSDAPYACGLNVYFPLSLQGSEEMYIFKDICVSPYYMALTDLCAYTSANLGDPSGYDYTCWLRDDSQSGYWNEDWDWDMSYDDAYWDGNYSEGLNFSYDNTAIKFIDEPYIDEDGFYTFQLTEESLYDLDTVYCNIMMSYWDDEDMCEYMLDLGTDDYVDMDWDTGVCSDNFSGYWFALPDGQPLCVYLTDVYYDDYEYYNTYTAPIYLNGEYTYLKIKQSYFTYDMTTEILGAWDGISEYGSADRELYQLRAGDVIEPCYPAYDVETGEYMFDFYGDEYICDGNSEINEDLLYSGDYYYAFEIYDLYGNALYSDFVLFGVEDDGSLYYYE